MVNVGTTDFDYIIVGAGSSGCVLAERLSVDPNNLILLLEAGGSNRSPLVSMPKGIAKLASDPAHAWHYPVTQSRGVDGARPEVWARGKGLGGSSAINGMIYTRGQPDDYNDWRMAGGTGWGWSDMKRVFMTMEDHALGADDQRGAGGPLHVEAGTLRYPVAEALIKAGEQMGLPRRDDLNREDQEGVGYYSHTIRNGRRVSAAVAFLTPARRRRNLHVVTGAMAERIVFTGRRAVGVACRVNGETVTYRARGEIIVAAGAIQSPVLLQLSGVGPADHLRSLGIEVVSDSVDVGARLREHLGYTMPYRLVGTAGLNHRFQGLGLVGSVLQYYLRRSGPLATGVFEIGAFVRTDPSSTRPDVQLYGGAFNFAIANKSDGVPGGAIDTVPGVSLYSQMLRLTSEGTIRITAPDPRAPLEIMPNWLSTDYDQHLAVATVRLMRRYMTQRAIAPYLGEELAPGAECVSDEDILAAVRANATCGLHAVGSCRMGGDNSAVVDARLRVQGVEGLRVVDCSIAPAPVSGNTSGPAMAIGWRGAELILEDLAFKHRGSSLQPRSIGGDDLGMKF